MLVPSYTILLICLLRKCISAPSTGTSSSKSKPTLTAYDQRQTGKFNFNLNIKDVQLISLRGDQFNAGIGDEEVYDYGDYDYNPADFTVNPILALLGIGGNSTHNATVKPPTNESVVAITAKPPTTPTTTTTSTKAPIIIQPLDAATNRTNATQAPDTISTVKVLVPKIPKIRRGLKRRVKNNVKAPFRLRAVYRRPHKHQVVPRKIMSEYVIEGPLLEGPVKNQVKNEDYEVDELEDEFEDDDDDDDDDGHSNSNKKKKKGNKKDKKNKRKKYPPYPYLPPYEDEDDDDEDHYYYPPPPYRPPYVEYEYVDDDDDDDLIRGGGKLDDLLGLYSLANFFNRRTG